MKGMITLAAVCLMSSSSWLSPARGPDPEDDFAKLFGEEAKRVADTKGKEDDVAFAKKLLEAARSVPDSPDFQKLLLERAFDFAATDPTGDATSLEALDLHASLYPNERASCDSRAISLLESRFKSVRREARVAAGEALLARLVVAANASEADRRWTDAIAQCERAHKVATEIQSTEAAGIHDRIEELRQRDTSEAKRVELQAALEQAADKTVIAKELCLLCVRELGDPRAAALHADDTGDQVLREMVSLAVKPSGTLTPDEAVKLADWYRGLATDATVIGQRRVLGMALRLYDMFLAGHEARDVERLRVSLAREEVSTQASRLGPGHKPSARFCGIEASGAHIAYVLDVSGSMQGPKLASLRAELLKSVNALPADAAFFVAFYSNDAMPMGQRLKWTPATDAGKRWAAEQATQQQAYGGTNPLPALQMVLEQTPRPDAIYFVTDGLFDEAVAKEVSKMNNRAPRVPIHCIAFDVQEQGVERLMRQIARESGGRYAAVPLSPSPPAEVPARKRR
jgi:hypothetical protein